jgi:IclR family pca regulon transcriptional regulator
LRKSKNLLFLKKKKQKDFYPCAAWRICMKVSISRSVGRAFETIEAFREFRRPVTATQMRRHLDYPHSSMVAVLHNLEQLGYLSYNASTHDYFPTEKLTSLASWAQPVLKGVGRLGEIVAAVARETGQTTTLACRSAFFLNVVHGCKGADPGTVEPALGIGESLTASAAGIAILSQLPQQDALKIIEQANRWAVSTGADRARPRDHLMAQLRDVQMSGVSISFSGAAAGMGAIAYPLSSKLHSTPLAMAITGRSQYIQAHAASFRQIVERHIGLHNLGGKAPWAAAAETSEEHDRPATRRATVTSYKKMANGNCLNAQRA